MGEKVFGGCFEAHKKLTVEGHVRLSKRNAEGIKEEDTVVQKARAIYLFPLSTFLFFIEARARHWLAVEGN